MGAVFIVFVDMRGTLKLPFVCFHVFFGQVGSFFRQFPPVSGQFLIDSGHRGKLYIFLDIIARFLDRLWAFLDRFPRFLDSFWMILDIRGDFEFFWTSLLAFWTD